jgi:predicted TIM-barrel fold metal-dependent hydrolase
MKRWVMSSTRRRAVGKRYASNVDRVTLCYVPLECFSLDSPFSRNMIGFKQIEFFDHTRIRLNLATGGQADPATGRRRFQAAIAQVQGLNWHIQMFASLAVIAGIRDLVLASDMPVVFDHFGGTNAALGVDQPGFGDLVDLLRSGEAYVKLSGAYRASTHGPDYADVGPYAKALIGANADRVLWGSDWPHPNTAISSDRKATDIAPLLQIDDGRLLNQLPIWAADPAVRKKILVDNPARLYGFW